MGRRQRRRSRSRSRSFFGRWLRRAVVLGGLSAAVGAFRNRQIEDNRRRYDLP